MIRLQQKVEEFIQDGDESATLGLQGDPARIMEAFLIFKRMVKNKPATAKQQQQDNVPLVEKKALALQQPHQQQTAIMAIPQVSASAQEQIDKLAHAVQLRDLEIGKQQL